MPLTLVRSATAQSAWAGCVDAFLRHQGESRGPRGHDAWAWLTHRNLRDLLFEAAFQHGVRGWLDPPISFLSELPDRFGIGGRPAGALTRRRLLARLAGRRAARELRPRRGGSFDRGPAIDALLGELLPEQVDPDDLEAALAKRRGDGFSARRDRWVIAVYRDYLQELAARGLYDDRSVHALIARRIEAGGLQAVIGGATSLHLYGLYTVRHRRRLLAALAAQKEVDVRLYAVAGGDHGLAELAVDVVEARGEKGVSVPVVQPAPDAAREHEWVAAQVKRILLGGECEPWQIAVVARSGRHDTLGVHRALHRAGIPSTARIRTPMHEIAAIKALLSIFDGAARGWDYRALRAVLTHPYLDTRVDVRSVDHVAHRARVSGLAAWEAALQSTRKQLGDKPAAFRGTGLVEARLDADLGAFARLRGLLEPLSEPRTESGWIAETMTLLERDFLALTSRSCEPAGDRWDVVRLDQRGLMQLRHLLDEWLRLEQRDERIEAERWHTLLRRLLETTELALTTPLHKGVQVLEAHDAAAQPLRHLFVVHANDGEFPRAGAGGAVLADEERTELAAAGLPLITRAERLAHERSLWHALTAQDGGVTISYRSTAAGGTPLLPSLLVPVRDVDLRPELPRARAASGPDASPVHPLAAERAAMVALARATRVEGAPRVALPVGDGYRVRHAVLAAVAEAGRDLQGSLPAPGGPAERPHAWNGAIRDPEVLRRLAAKFDDAHRWSARVLESYATCPFNFLVDRVLDLRSLDEADEETTALTSGAVTHDLLEAFYQRLLDSLPGDWTEEAEAALARSAQEVMARWESTGEWLGMPPLWSVTREQIVDAVRAYLQWELPYLEEKGERPERLEYSFGHALEPLTIQGEDLAGRRRSMRITGRIDRIDVDAKGRASVLDYKRTYTPAPGYSDGTTLQSALYLRALEAEGTPARTARYRGVGRPGKPQNGATIKAGSEDYEIALRIAFSIPDRVRRGLFEAAFSARSGGRAPWHVGPEVTRSSAKLSAGGTRFDE